MIRLLKCEYKKTKNRYIVLTAIIITIIQLCWALYGSYNEETLSFGYMIFLYQLPLINSIFIPILAIVVSSRLCDIEHKGIMFKQLCTIAPKGKIYDAKLIYGLSIIIVCILMSWIVIIAFGKYMGFKDEFPLNLYLLYLLFTIIPSISVYIFQHILAIFFKNQAIGFFVGVIGTFAGMFSMFLPSVTALRKSLLWGHFGVLQFVGMFGWSKETRMKNVRFDVMEIDWEFFVVIIFICVFMYAVGKVLFTKKDV